MKKYLYFLMSAMLVVLSAGCNSDEENAQISENGAQVSENANEVRWGVVYEGFTHQEIDKSDPLSVFFGEELHTPYWDNNGNEHKTFFEQNEYNDESILVINSQDEFQKTYMGMKELPDVDFNQYTLVIGRTWGSDYSYELSDITLLDRDLTYELETQLIRHHYTDVAIPGAILTIFYWRLYPKLDKKTITPIRSVTDVDG